MGLLSFLSKKSYTDLTGRDSLKTSAYDVTVASSPPIRGTYPVAGNGTKILEQFQKSHPNLAPAPPPLVPRLHDDSFYGGGIERPRTAPSSQLSGTRSRGSSNAQSQPQAPLPAPVKKKYGPYKLPPKIVIDDRASLLPSNPAPSPGLASLYSSSIRSGESAKGKGYVDLLDAHSLIRPSDFHGRVQAAGVKNYGEDVADRNNQENSKSNIAIQVADPQASNGAKRTLPSKNADVGHNEKPLPARPRVRHSIGSSLRSQYSNPHAPEPFPKRTSSRFPLYAEDVSSDKPMSRAASARSERAARRRSVPSYMVPASGNTSRSSSTGRRENGKDPESFPDSLKGRARAATSNKRQAAAAHLTLEIQPQHKRNDSEKTLPDLPVSAWDRSRRKTISHSNSAVESSSRGPVKRQSLQGMRSKSHGEIYDDTYQHRAKSSQGGTQSLTKDRNSSTRRHLGSTTDLQGFSSDSPAQQCDRKSHVASSTTKNPNRGGIKSKLDHIRTRSMASLSNKSTKSLRMHDLEPSPSIPGRRSSLRHGSVTSETAMSTLSSNPFRPQSGHTTTTSVDCCLPLSPHPLSANQNLSIPPVPKIPFTDPFEFSSSGKAPASSPTRSSATAQRRHSSEFYLDDYASSNSDRSPSPPGGSHEKDLLFSDGGYGVSGLQLPGLPESFDVTMSSIPISTPTLSAVTVAGEPSLSTTMSQSRNILHSEIDNIVSLLRMPAYIQSDSDSDDSFEKRMKEKEKERNKQGQSQKEKQKQKQKPVVVESSYKEEEELNFDIPMSRARPPTFPRHTRTAEGRFHSKGRSIKEHEGDDSDF